MPDQRNTARFLPGSVRIDVVSISKPFAWLTFMIEHVLIMRMYLRRQLLNQWSRRCRSLMQKSSAQMGEFRRFQLRR